MCHEINSPVQCKRNHLCFCVATAFFAVQVSIRPLGCYAVDFAAAVAVPGAAAVGAGADTVAAVGGCLLVC